MLRRIALALLPLAAFGQPTPKFEAASIRVSPPSSHLWPSGPYVGASRYEFRNATMVDLISAAYGMDEDKVLGGGSWVGWDRFDVVAKPPAESTKESRKLMLQALLAERFGLVIHNDKKPLPGYALNTGKHGGLKEADPKGEAGCKVAAQQRPADGAPPVPSANYTCHNVTMAAFVEALPNMRFVPGILQQKPVVDNTGLAGAWDFSFHYSPPVRIAGAAVGSVETITLFEAIDKQLGLKLESTKVPMPVMVVDSVNRKTSPNPSDVEKSLPAPATEFEVAEIKPAQPQQARGGVMINGGGVVFGGGTSIKNGRVTLSNLTLKDLIIMAWNIDFDEQLVDAPKWMEADHYDVVAKVPHDGLLSEDDFDFDPIAPMLQKLLIDRFKLAVHTDVRPVTGYTLAAAKPKMQAADPASQTQCKEGPGPDGKDPRIANPALSRLLTCQNVSMQQFAELLPGLAGGYFRGAAAVNSTGLEGGYDFTLSFSAAGIVNGGRRGGDAGATASDPTGGLSLFDALTKQLGLKLEQQKLPRSVVVIDHAEQKPTDN